MYPELCRIGPFTVYSYGVMLVVAFFISTYLAKAKAKRDGLSPDILFNFCFMVFICGVIGARLFYVLENIEFYRNNILDIVMLQKGGLSWYGGLISAGVIGPLYLKIKKIPVYKILDLIAPFLALGQAIGRIGCLLNGCCFGKETPYGIYFPVHDKIIFPSQMVSVILMLIIFMILRVLQDKPHAQGRIFFLYLFLYSLKRFFVEFIRSDNPAVIFNLTLFQIISFIIFCFAGYKLFALRKKLIT